MSVHSDWAYKIRNNLMTEEDWNDYYADLQFEYAGADDYPPEEYDEEYEDDDE